MRLSTHTEYTKGQVLTSVIMEDCLYVEIIRGRSVIQFETKLYKDDVY